jgi:hypothetical protein
MYHFLSKLSYADYPSIITVDLFSSDASIYYFFIGIKVSLSHLVTIFKLEWNSFSMLTIPKAQYCLTFSSLKRCLSSIANFEPEGKSSSYSIIYLLILCLIRLYRLMVLFFQISNPFSFIYLDTFLAELPLAKCVKITSNNSLTGILVNSWKIYSSLPNTFVCSTVAAS